VCCSWGQDSPEESLPVILDVLGLILAGSAVPPAGSRSVGGDGTDGLGGVVVDDGDVVVGVLRVRRR